MYMEKKKKIFFFLMGVVMGFYADLSRPVKKFWDFFFFFFFHVHVSQKKGRLARILRMSTRNLRMSTRNFLALMYTVKKNMVQSDLRDWNSLGSLYAIFSSLTYAYTKCINLELFVFNVHGTWVPGPPYDLKR